MAALQIMNWNYFVADMAESVVVKGIRSSDNDSTGFWPPGSLHTLGADGHI